MYWVWHQGSFGCQPLLADHAHSQARKSLVHLDSVVGHVKSPVFHVVTCWLVIGHAVVTCNCQQSTSNSYITTDSHVSNEQAHVTNDVMRWQDNGLSSQAYSEPIVVSDNMETYSTGGQPNKAVFLLQNIHLLLPAVQIKGLETKQVFQHETGSH